MGKVVVHLIWEKLFSFSFAHFFWSFSSSVLGKVIKWLWQIVGKEFSEEEQGKFLKFCTSCSKPPILGFSALHPRY